MNRLKDWNNALEYVVILINNPVKMSTNQVLRGSGLYKTTYRVLGKR